MIRPLRIAALLWRRHVSSRPHSNPLLSENPYHVLAWLHWSYVMQRERRVAETLAQWSRQPVEWLRSENFEERKP